MEKFKLGKKPARKTAKRLWLSKYLNRSILKIDNAPARNFGGLAKAAAQAAWTDPLGNADWGCCFWSAAFRYAMARRASVGTLTDFTAQAATHSVLQAYAAATGFNYSQDTDNGTDALAGMNFLQQTGLVMPDGATDKIGSYVWVNPQDYETLLLAFNLFDGLMVGVEFPGSWEDAQVWDITTDPIEGGHEIFGDDDTLHPTADGIEINSWGDERLITPAAIAKFADEIAVVIAPDMLFSSGKSIAGFDNEQLDADEKVLAVPY